MASWNELPDPHAGDDLAYAEAWENRQPDEPRNYYGQPIVSPEYFDGAHIVNPGPAGEPPVCACGWTPWGTFTMTDHLADMTSDVEYADEDEQGQLGLGVPGEQRAIPTLAAVAECQCSPIERIAADNDPRNGSTAARIIRATEGICNGCGGRR